MAVTQIHEALGSFEFELIDAVPRELIDAIEYFSHIAIVPGRMNPKEYGDATLTAARYVGVVRHKKLADDGRTNLIMDDMRISGVGMNFWLGDEDSKGAVIETPLSFTNANFSTVVTALRPASLTAGTTYAVSGSYSGRHVYETPRSALQYVCDTMSSTGIAVYDTFNRADSTTVLGQLDSGQTWVQDLGTWGINSNSAYISAATDSTATISVAAGFDAQVTVQTIASGTSYFLFRYLNATNYWRIGAATSAGAIVLEKVVAGVVTTVATLGINMANSTTLRITTAGDTIFAYVNGVLQTQTTDSFNNTATKLGMKCSATSTRFETFNVSPTNDPISFRVNNNGSLDTGPESSLFVTSPQCVIVRKGTSFGEDMTMRALPTNLDLDQDMDDFSTRTLMLAEANGESLSTGSADIATVAPGVNIYKDLQGNPIQLTRMISESETLDQNADVRAELALRKVIAQRRNLTLSTEDYDIFGTFTVGDYIYLYDPDAGLTDSRYEVTIRGARINPVKLQVTETDWPVTSDYTVGLRDANGVWYDLTDYIRFDQKGPSKVVIGDFQRQLTDIGQTLAGRVGSMTQADATTPAAPAWVTASFQTVAYLDSVGNVKAHQKLVWLQPLNTDGTTVLDGDHYEIQTRLNSGGLYSQTWGAAGANTWANMNTWNQPVASDSIQWMPQMISWDTNVAIIHELSAGTEYDVRIRAIDSGNNTSAWSSVEQFTTAVDNIPPSQPNAPQVASSLIAIQVIHDMGKSSGGTFNLENDLAYFEVHGEYEPGFNPTLATKLGNMRANRGMMTAQTPAVQTFQVSNTAAIYIKVVAVDISGNRSSPSIASPATATLIDDAHISDLTVTKITAGTILADWIMSGSIKTALEGARVEIDALGIRTYDTDNLQTVNISAQDGSVALVGSVSSANFLEAVSGWAIQQDGSTQFQNLNCMGTITGTTGYYDALFMGGIAVPSRADVNDFYQTPTPCLKMSRAAAYSTSATTLTWTRVDWDFQNYSINSGTGLMWNSLTPARLISPTDGLYEFSFNLQFLGGSNGHSTILMLRRNSGGSDSGGARLYEGYVAGPPFDGTTTFRTGNVGTFATYLSEGDYVEAFARSDTAVARSLNVGGDGTAYIQMRYLAGFKDGVIDAAPPVGQTLSYSAIDCASYYDTGSLRTTYGNDRMYQGRYDGVWEHQRSMAFFDFASIQADLAGKNVQGVTLRYKVEHSYNDTLDTVVGTHAVDPKPGTDAGTGANALWTFRNQAKGGTYEMSLGSSTALEFQSGVSLGIRFGFQNGSGNSDFQYYGYLYGLDGTGNQPVLTFSYTD